jgi:hypothetical protein
VPVDDPIPFEDAGLIKSDPNKIIADHSDWPFLNEPIFAKRRPGRPADVESGRPRKRAQVLGDLPAHEQRGSAVSLF